MTELSRLIQRLERGISTKASYIDTIRHPQLLIVSLKELNGMIGNEKIKDAVAIQVSHLIIIKVRALENDDIQEDEVMLNTVLYGEPGCGKTSIGVKLAKIWYSLGYLDGSRNPKAKRGEIGGFIKGMFGDTSSSSSTDDSTIAFYVIFLFITVLLTVLSLTWSFYNKFGGMNTAIITGVILLFVLIIGWYIFASLNASDENTISTSEKAANNKPKPNAEQANANEEESENSTVIYDLPPDDQIIKVVTRADFVAKYVGWSDKKTVELLEENLGKVLFVDEAYSLVNSPHDSFGMEALTALNLFLSQRPTEIIVIFAGYKDLLESGPFSVQPGLKRRFMWQFDSNGYSPDELFEIFKLQLRKKGWRLTDEPATLLLFQKNPRAFPAYGGDTERCAFFAELEHSRDYINAETEGLQLNALLPKHVARGIDKLKENSVQDNDTESNNPMANVMNLMSRKKKNPTRSSSGNIDQDELFNSILDAASKSAYR